MIKVRQGFIAAILALVPALLAGCHGSGTETVKWVKQSDSTQVLELRLPVRSVVGKVHQVVFGERLKGSYVLWEGGAATAKGSVTQDKGDFILVSAGGKKQRFEREESSSLKDEDGAIWEREAAAGIAKPILKKW